MAPGHVSSPVEFKENIYLFPPCGKASREVANLTERINPHTPVYGVKAFVCLYVLNFGPNYLKTGRTEWAEIVLGHLWQKGMSQKFSFGQKVGGRAGAEGQNSNISWNIYF